MWHPPLALELRSPCGGIGHRFTPRRPHSAIRDLAVVEERDLDAVLGLVADLRVDEERLLPEPPQAVHGIWDTRIVPCLSRRFTRLRLSGSAKRSANPRARRARDGARFATAVIRSSPR